jgi:hypothetical protein
VVPHARQREDVLAEEVRRAVERPVHRRGAFRGEHAREGGRVVGVQPVGDRVGLGGKEVWLALRRDPRDLGQIRVEVRDRVGVLRERGVVDEAVLRDEFLEHEAEAHVREPAGGGHVGLGGLGPHGRARAPGGDGSDGADERRAQGRRGGEEKVAT